MQEEKNNVNLIGKIITPIEFGHELYGERFLNFEILIRRQSDVEDIIPILISERLLNEEFKIGETVEIEGEFRSYNEYDKGKYHLRLNVFVKKIEKLDYSYDMNEIKLRGFLCKQPVYRETMLGRQIADLLIAVNRNYNKSDYIPCIAWGRSAKYLEKFPVGTEIELEGRIQSRGYNKMTEDGEVISKIAREVSISKFKILN